MRLILFTPLLTLFCLPGAGAHAQASNDNAVSLSPAARFAKETDEVPNFQRHVVPLLGRLGCNGRNCHGSFQGRGGLRLSMFGYDFAADHTALTGGDRPRVDEEAPEFSLMLLKPTSEKGHGGGKRFEEDGWEHRALLNWIKAGAKGETAGASLVRLEVTPEELLFTRVGGRTRLRVVAHWSDGSREDVTPLARFHSNDDGVVKVDASGMVECVGKGSTHVITSYDRAVVSNPAILPVTELAGEKYPGMPTPTAIDEKVVGNLRKLGIVPSALCTDEEFLRRVSLDITGTLPTPEEVRAFLKDRSADKRGKKIDELLERPGYWTWWTTRLCDLTGLNAPLTLGGTEAAKISGEQWHRWIEKRVADNVGYHEIARGLIVAVSRRPGQNYTDFATEMSLYTRNKDPLDYATREYMPHFWHRGNLGLPEEKALAFAHVFMGVRLDCAQCHKHPFDRWSQQDFKQFTAFFERINRGIAPDAVDEHEAMQKSLGYPIKKPAAERRGFYLQLHRAGKPAPWREVYIEPLLEKGQKRRGSYLPSGITPRILGGAEFPDRADVHPLEPVMNWLLEKDNPYFAPAFVNRVWAYYFGRGIVDPPDDFNLGNPPGNRELLDYLARGFVEHGYDMKWLHREICNSDAYQRSWQPNKTNTADEVHFSRAMIRRLPAEIAIDAIDLATLEPKQRPAWFRDHSKRRIARQATAYNSRTEFGLVVYGKPLRLSNCDCERENAPSLLQTIYLRNDQDLHAMLDRPTSWVKNLDPKAEPDDLIEEAYLRCVSRPPTDRELERCRQYLRAAPNASTGVRDVLWALLNTKEFITNH